MNHTALNDLESLIQLTGIPHLGSIKIRLLVQYFGSANAVLQADPKEISELPGFGPKFMESFCTSVSLRKAFALKEIDLAERQGVQIIPYTSADYPKRLLEIPDFPVLLYVKGKLKEKDKQSLAVVGTRNMSIYGGEMAEKLSRDLASAGMTIVSGLARGIDTAAHRGALQKGRTIAVIGSGLGDIYPQENVALVNAILERDAGAVISEFSMKTPPDKQNFPQRNRIVSGMTLGTLLIEAPRKSGAMITMEKALVQAKGRKLFALPGRADCESFQGNHYLIKKRLAHLVENAQDILENFEDLFSDCPAMIAASPSGIFLEPEEAHFLGQLPAHEVCFDDIAHLVKLPVMKINVLLMSLLMKKAIKEFPGKIYKKIETIK